MREMGVGWLPDMPPAAISGITSVALPLLMKIVPTLNREKDLSRLAQKPRENGSKPHSETAARALTGQIARRKEKPFGRDARGLQKVKGLLAR